MMERPVRDVHRPWTEIFNGQWVTHCSCGEWNSSMERDEAGKPLVKGGHDLKNRFTSLKLHHQHREDVKRRQRARAYAR